MINGNNFLTLKEAAAYLGMEYETLRYHVKKNRGPDFTQKGKIRLFTKEWLDAWKKVDRRKENHA